MPNFIKKTAPAYLQMAEYKIVDYAQSAPPLVTWNGRAPFAYVFRKRRSSPISEVNGVNAMRREYRNKKNIPI